MMRRYSVPFFITLLASSLVFSAEPKQTQPVVPTHDTPDMAHLNPPSDVSKANVIDEATLRRHPELIARALDQTIRNGQTDAISALLPLYEQVPDAHKNTMLIRYARATLAAHAGNLKEAIHLYREMLAQNSDLPPVRLQLAMALAADRQDSAAEEQFLRLRGENLPPEVLKIVDNQLSHLHENNQWSFHLSGYYQQDNNINDAPIVSKIVKDKDCDEKKIRIPGFHLCSIQYETPVKVSGIHYDIGVDKNFSLKGGVYAGLNASISGDQWDKHSYNSQYITLGTTLGWRNSRQDFSINPFVRRFLYAGHAYSLTTGMNINAEQWLTKDWRVSLYGQLAYAKYDSRPWLNGGRYYIGLNGLHIANASRYFFAGIGLYRNQTTSPEDTFNLSSMNLGWVQEWAHGISTRLSGSLLYRSYAGINQFNSRRKDNEYNVGLNLWKRDWHLWTLTPKLVFNWNKRTSNQSYYDRKPNTSTYIEFSKTF